MSEQSRHDQWAVAQEHGAKYYVQEEHIQEKIWTLVKHESPSAVRHGINFAVLKTSDPSLPAFVMEVWDRGVWLPIRPFYEKRIEWARSRTARVVGALSLKNS